MSMTTPSLCVVPVAPCGPLWSLLLASPPRPPRLHLSSLLSFFSSRIRTTEKGGRSPEDPSPIGTNHRVNRTTSGKRPGSWLVRSAGHNAVSKKKKTSIPSCSMAVIKSETFRGPFPKEAHSCHLLPSSNFQRARHRPVPEMNANRVDRCDYLFSRRSVGNFFFFFFPFPIVADADPSKKRKNLV